MAEIRLDTKEGALFLVFEDVDGVYNGVSKNFLLTWAWDGGESIECSREWFDETEYDEESIFPVNQEHPLYVLLGSSVLAAWLVKEPGDVFVYYTLWENGAVFMIEKYPGEIKMFILEDALNSVAAFAKDAHALGVS